MRFSPRSIVLLLGVALSAACATPPAPLPPPPAAAAAAAPAVVSQPAEPPVAPRTTPDAAFRNQLPTPGAERTFKVPAVKRFRLGNGLPVILAESHKLPLVGIELVIKTGNAANPKGRAGLADLCADLLDEGTKTRSAMAIAEEISLLGASLGTGAGWDATSLSVSGLSETLDKALVVWADVLLNPAFDEAEFTRVRNNLLTAFRARRDSPPMVAGLAYARAVYGDEHPYAWPTSGTETTIASLTVADLRRFWETHYRPNNAVLVVAGDIDEAGVRAKIEPLLRGWKSRPVPRATLPKAALATKAKVVLVDKEGAPQSSIRIGHVGIDRKNPDYHRALVMNHILGGSFRRLDLQLREGKGWTYGVRSSFEARRTPGPWTVGGEFVAKHTTEAVAHILGEIRALASTEVTDKELNETKNEIIKAFPSRFATVNQLAGQMATLAVYDLPNNELESYTKKIAAVTRKDVQRMAKKYLHPDRATIVVVGDKRSNEETLRKIAEIELRDVDGNLVPANASN